MLKGYDYFTPNAGEVESMICKVCGSVCDVKRDVVGARSFGGSMAGIKVKHDSFSCPHGKKKWHEQAMKLFRNIEGIPSPTLKKIMIDDLKKMIKDSLEK